MSVEKLSNNSKLECENIPFTQICNKVITDIKDSDSFLVWCYLQSKTNDWKVIKQNVKNNYGFGDKKLKRIFSYLSRSNLITYVQVLNSSCQFERMDILVLNGSKFDKNQPFINKEPVGQKTARAENGTNRNDELLNKETTKQRKSKTNISCSSADERDEKFVSLSKIYPRKENIAVAYRTWQKKKLALMADKIIDAVENRLQKDWLNKEKQYIPLLSTYLNGQRWDDEPINEQPKPVIYAKPNEIRSTVSEFPEEKPLKKSSLPLVNKHMNSLKNVLPSMKRFSKLKEENAHDSP